ncbi:hypothetical protein PMAYCL1PPCAC_09961, partial [Pristionchus mayeri]
QSPISLSLPLRLSVISACINGLSAPASTHMPRLQSKSRERALRRYLMQSVRSLLQKDGSRRADVHLP